MTFLQGDSKCYSQMGVTLLIRPFEPCRNPIFFEITSNKQVKMMVKLRSHQVFDILNIW